MLPVRVIFTIFCDFWCSTGYFFCFLSPFGISFYYFYVFFFLSVGLNNDNNSKWRQSLWIYLYLYLVRSLSSYYYLLPLVNRHKSVCVFQPRHKNKESKTKNFSISCPYGHCAHNSNENNNTEWMKTTFVTSLFMYFSSLLWHRIASHHELNQKWTNKDIRNIFIWVLVPGIFITVALRASSTPFTCQLYLWLFIYFVLLSL